MKKKTRKIIKTRPKLDNKKYIQRIPKSIKTKTYNKDGKKLTKKIYKFKYLDNGKQIQNKKLLERYESLGIPPAYTNVNIAKKQKAKIQAFGMDDRGRKQYIYNPDFIKKKREEKYNNILYLGNHINQIEKDIHKTLNDISHKKYKDWIQPISNIAIIIYLLSKCNIRIGNQKYLNLYGSYGATTLLKKHIKTRSKNKKYILIEFIGKKGVLNQSIIYNNKIINIFKELIRNKKSDDRLFEYNGNIITNDQVNNYLRMYNNKIQPKMFRTWYANIYFINKLRDDLNKKNIGLKKLCTDGKNNKYLKSCFEEVAKRLHNTANISKKSYVDHLIIDTFTSHPKKFILFLKMNKRLNDTNLLLYIIKNIRNLE